MRANPLVARAYLFRGARLWIITRLAASGVLALAGENPLRLSAATIVAIIVVSATLGYIDTHLHRESVLLGNLGISLSGLATFFVAPALAGEMMLWSFRLISA